MKRIALALIACLWASLAFGQPIDSGSQRFSLIGAASGTTAGTTAALAAAQGKTTYICGLAVAPGSATAAITITIQVTGIPTGFTFSVVAPVTAAGTTGAMFQQNFTPCVPASAQNTQIVIQAGALGAGGVNQFVNAWGYQASPN